jgi:hypothetical protein
MSSERAISPTTRGMHVSRRRDQVAGSEDQRTARRQCSLELQQVPRMQRVARQAHRDRAYRRRQRDHGRQRAAHQRGRPRRSRARSVVRRRRALGGRDPSSPALAPCYGGPSAPTGGRCWPGRWSRYRGSWTWWWQRHTGAPPPSTSWCTCRLGCGARGSSVTIHCSSGTGRPWAGSGTCWPKG